MAIILDLKDDKSFLLMAHHSFGRLSSAVTTVLSQPQISKHHATIEWRDEHWHIRDFSRNGTWVSSQKIEPNQYIRLKKGDTISFASMDNKVFRIIDLSPPKDCLIPLNSTIPDFSNAIALEQSQLFPSEEQPQAEVYIDGTSHQWQICSLVKDDFWQIQMSHNDTVELDGQTWQLWQSSTTVQTQLAEVPHYTMSGLNFIFDISLDEEQTKLSLAVENSQDNICLGEHNHHYFVQHLARYKKADIDKGLDPAQQGWVHKEILMKELGIDDVYLSVLVHRARKQFREKTNIHDCQGIVERQARSGLLRFGGFNFEIHKGQNCLFKL